MTDAIAIAEFFFNAAVITEVPVALPANVSLASDALEHILLRPRHKFERRAAKPGELCPCVGIFSP